MQHTPHLTFAEIAKRDVLVRAVMRVRDTCDLINQLVAESSTLLTTDALASLVDTRFHLIEASCVLKDQMTKQLAQTVPERSSSVVLVGDEIRTTR